MPRYRVKQPAFFDGRLVGPGTKRPVIHTDKPLKPAPSWAEPLKEESGAQKKARQAAEKQTAKEQKAKQDADRKEVESVSFMTGNESAGPGVETL